MTIKKINKKNYRSAKVISFIQSLSIDQMAKANKRQLGDMVYFLNTECNISYQKISAMCNGMPVSTLQKLAKPTKSDNNSRTQQMVRHGLDYDVLLRHFQTYIPKEDEEENFSNIALAIHKKEDEAVKQRDINNSNKKHEGNEKTNEILDMNLRRAVAGLKPYTNLTFDYDVNRTALLIELKNIIDKLIIKTKEKEE